MNDETNQQGAGGVPRALDGAGATERGDWRSRLDYIDTMMRDMSVETDPQAMVRSFGGRMRRLYQSDGFVSVSRRGLSSPQYRITRSSTWDSSIDPWREPHRLPLYSSGLLGELLYAGKPRLIQDLRVSPDDPAASLLAGAGSLLAVPHYDKGEAINMVLMLRRKTNDFDPELVPEIVWVSALFGRATGNLVLLRQLAEINAALDREMKQVADIQQSLLPTELPRTPGLDWAAHYQTSRNAGGDYYDFFHLPGGRLGILIADVSGHGTPAAVLMALLHAIAHFHPGAPEHPAGVLAWINRELCRRYTANIGAETMFVTAFYAVYDPATGRLEYSSAGHNPPRLRVGFTGPGGPVLEMDKAQSLPLGLMEDARFTQAGVDLEPGDAVVFYTDGITETFGPQPGGVGPRPMYGTDRLDEIISRPHDCARTMLQDILASVDAFAQGVPAADDRTILIATAQDR